MLFFITNLFDHQEILHMSQQLHCRDMQNYIVISVWYFKPEHSKLSFNFELHQNTISAMSICMHNEAEFFFVN